MGYRLAGAAGGRGIVTGTISGYGVKVGLGDRAGEGAVPAVRGERLAAVREWLEVGLPQVLFHRAVL